MSVIIRGRFEYGRGEGDIKMEVKRNVKRNGKVLSL